jgi:predicted pyridoxine 5'-phosphate oxidase superfamily flavin-nucleotide-binding protein
VMIEDYGVPGIVPARIARRVVEGLRQIIDDLALALVAPLRADYTDRLRSRLLSHRRRPTLRQAAPCPYRRLQKHYRWANTNTSTINSSLRSLPKQA